MVAAVAPSGEQLRGERMSLFSGNNAAAGALIKASSKIEIILAPPLESFWGCVTQLSAACSVEGVASEANPADNASRNKPMFKASDVEGEVASPQM